MLTESDIFFQTKFITYCECERVTFCLRNLFELLILTILINSNVKLYVYNYNSKIGMQYVTLT